MVHLRLIRLLVASTLATTLATTGLAAGSQAGRKPSVTAGPTKAAGYVPSRTPWGDPQFEGVYSNDDETGVPFERPAQFDGRRIEDITPEELSALNRQRNEQFNAGVAGTEFAGGIRPPTHLIFDSFDRKNSSPWLVVDPPDGKVPPLTEEARMRVRRPISLKGRGVRSFAMTLKQKTQGERIYEYACHEGNYGLKNILTGARAKDDVTGHADARK